MFGSCRACRCQQRVYILTLQLSKLPTPLITHTPHQCVCCLLLHRPTHTHRTKPSAAACTSWHTTSSSWAAATSLTFSKQSLQSSGHTVGDTAQVLLGERTVMGADMGVANPMHTHGLLFFGQPPGSRGCSLRVCIAVAPSASMLIRQMQVVPVCADRYVQICALLTIVGWVPSS